MAKDDSKAPAGKVEAPELEHDGADPVFVSAGQAYDETAAEAAATSDLEATKDLILADEPVFVSEGAAQELILTGSATDVRTGARLTLEDLPEDRLSLVQLES